MRSDESFIKLLMALLLGYQKLVVQAVGVSIEIELIVAPPSCHLPEALQPGRHSWGLTAQLYGLRSGSNWGIGDFTDLAWLASAAGRLGAATIGINPLHALFAAEPRHYTPYSPSSR